MIRFPTLLPALVLLFSLAGASLAMTAEASSSKTTTSQTATKTTGKLATKSESCSDTPMYESPDYCHPRGG